MGTAVWAVGWTTPRTGARLFALWATAVLVLTSLMTVGPGEIANTASAAINRAAALAAVSDPKGAPVDMKALKSSYASLPLSFEVNKGQAAEGVDFLARGNGYSIALRPQGAALLLGGKPSGIDPVAQPGVPGHMVGVEIVGGSPTAVAEVQERLPGVVNYYIGVDPKAWTTGIETFGKVHYSGVYPGIDIVYYGNQQKLEYDFVVAPAADPDVIRLRFPGAQAPRIDAAGNLVLTTKAGDLVQEPPTIYQDVNGERRPVDGRFFLDGISVGFSIGNYDPLIPLVIDPTLQYSTFLGGNGQEPGYDIDVDPTGNVYVTGVTNSMTNPPNTTGQLEPFPILNPWGTPGGAMDSWGGTCCGGSDTGRVFVTKLNATGSALIFSTFLGGYAGFGSMSPGDASAHQKCPSPEGCGSAPGFARGWDSGHGIASDSAGNAYVTGWAESLDFPTTATAPRPSHPGPRGCTDPTCYLHDYLDHPRDAFVAKFGPTGALLFSSLIGGRGGDGGLSIDVVDSGPGIGVHITGIAQSVDWFVNDSNSPVIGGYGNTTHYGQANVTYQDMLNRKPVATGGFVTRTDPPYPTCQGATHFDDWSCWRDAFVLKLDYNNLAVPIFNTLLGGTADEGGYGIVVDRSTGNVVVVGESESTDFPVTPNAFQPCLGGNGGYHAEPELEPAADTPFPCHLTPTPGVGQPNSFIKPNVDAFVAKFSPIGAPIFVSYLGGSMDDDSGATLDDKAGDFGKSVAMDSTGNIYMTGWTESTSTPIAMCGLAVPPADKGTAPCPHSVPFPTTPGAYMETMPQDTIASCGPTAPPDCIPPNKRLHAVAFLTKMNPMGQFGPTFTGTYSTYLGGYGDDAGFVVVVDSLGQAYVGGVADSTNFPGTATGTIPGYPNTVPTGRYINHGPGCPGCGGYIGGILPPYDVDNPPQASDGFIVKFNAAGNGLIYSSFLGGAGDDVIHGIAHSTRNGFHGIYLSGLTGSQNNVPPNPVPLMAEPSVDSPLASVMLTQSGVACKTAASRACEACAIWRSSAS